MRCKQRRRGQRWSVDTVTTVSKCNDYDGLESTDGEHVVVGEVGGGQRTVGFCCCEDS